jgi:hypothetical protein
VLGNAATIRAMQKGKLIRLPIICDALGDLYLPWWVEFYCRNPRNNKLERQRIYKGINKFHTVRERMQAAQKICDYYTDQLKNEWSPFSNQLVIYDDNLQTKTTLTYSIMVYLLGKNQF